jgi:hypothetical protein
MWTSCSFCRLRKPEATATRRAQPVTSPSRPGVSRISRPRPGSQPFIDARHPHSCRESLIFEGIGVSPDAIVLGTLLALNGFVTTMWNIVTVSLRQQVVPAEFLGRVNGVYRMLGWGLSPLGALTGGLVAHELGLRAGYPVAGALRGIALLVALPVLIAAVRAVKAESAT